LSKPRYATLRYATRPARNLASFERLARYGLTVNLLYNVTPSSSNVLPDLTSAPSTTMTTFKTSLALAPRDHHLGFRPVEGEAVVLREVRHGVCKTLKLLLRLLDVVRYDP
jgi:hypothetical protein